MILTWEIPKEIYDRSVNGCIAKEDKMKVYGMDILHGYGLYGEKVFEHDGKYYVTFVKGDSCD